MKTNHALVAAPLLFILGAVTSREIFPKNLPLAPPEPPSLSTRAERKIIRVQRSGDETSPVSPTDLQGLLDLVNPQIPFETSTRLRAALGDLGPGALEDLILQLNEDFQRDPGFSTLRYSLLNHLVSKDPFHALDMILAHEDAAFRSASIALIMQGAAHLDLDAAKEALGLIEDEQLKQLARNTVMNTAMNSPESTSEDLLTLLNGETATPQHFINYGYNPWNQYSSWGSHYVFNQVNTSGALVKLAQKDLAAAEKYALGLKTQGERNNALLQIAHGLAQEDPDLALEWVRNSGEDSNRDQNIVSVLSQMASRDPLKAASHLEEITNVNQRHAAISSIASQWAQKDPGAAIAWLDNLPASRTRLDAYSNVARQLSQTDPRAAIDLIENLPGNFSSNVLPNILSQWAHKDFEAARTWATSQTDPIKLNSAISSIISPWAQKDPSAAAAFLEQSASNAPASYLKNHFNNLSRQWAAQDKDAALNWASRLENAELRRSAQGGIYQSWAIAEPAEAANHLASLNNPEDRQMLLQTLAQSWVNKDPEATRAWLGTLPPDERFQAAGSAISSLSNSQPNVAADLFDRLVIEAGSNEDQLRAFKHQSGNIASNWSAYAPAEAAEWAQGIPTESEQASAYRNIASNWSQFDLPGTAGWIDGLPVGKPRDQATETFIQNIQQIDPAAAFDWADTINNDSSRYNSIQGVLNQWKQSDPEGARQAAVSANITEKQRERLLKQF